MHEISSIFSLIEDPASVAILWKMWKTDQVLLGCYRSYQQNAKAKACITLACGRFGGARNIQHTDTPANNIRGSTNSSRQTRVLFRQVKARGT